MSIFSRFFGKRDAEQSSGQPAQLVANPEIAEPLSLQLLFSAGLPVDPGSITQTLRSYHRSMSAAGFENEAELGRKGTLFALAGWGKHVIRVVGFDAPMPAEVVERCVGPSHYAQDLKQKARAHRSHAILYYAGYDTSPLDQYVALAAVCGVLSRFGAIVILNESAHTSFPAEALAGVRGGEDMMELLRTLPLPILYTGFVKYNVEDVPGVWMRTHGANLLGLPDFAIHAEGHNQGQQYFQMFDNILRYLHDSKAKMVAGHTMQVGEDEYLRVRSPGEAEAFLHDGEGELLIAEIIGGHQINQ